MNKICHRGRAVPFEGQEETLRGQRKVKALSMKVKCRVASMVLVVQSIAKSTGGASHGMRRRYFGDAIKAGSLN